MRPTFVQLLCPITVSVNISIALAITTPMMTKIKTKNPIVPKAVWPELECPNYVVELHAPPNMPVLHLTKELTNVSAKPHGKDIWVRFSPPLVHHCECPYSNSWVYSAVAYTSYYGFTEKCRFSYIVKDITPPVFTKCPKDMHIFENEEVTFKKPDYWDNVGIAKIQSTMDPDRRTYPPGNYSFKYKVIDWDGNRASCSFLLSVSPIDKLPQGHKKGSSDGSNILAIVAPIAGVLTGTFMVVGVVCCRRAHNRANAPQHRPHSAPQHSQHSAPQHSQHSAPQHGPGCAPQHRPCDTFDNHIYAIPADVKPPDYNSLPPNPPAYHNDNISMHSDYTFLPPPEYKEVDELRVPTGYINPDYSTIPSVNNSVES